MAATMDPRARLDGSLTDFEPPSSHHRHRHSLSPTSPNILRSRHPNTKALPRPRPTLHRPPFPAPPPTAPGTETDCASSAGVLLPVSDPDQDSEDPYQDQEDLRAREGEPEEEEEEEEEEDQDQDQEDYSVRSAGGYSPPAWRRLEGGTRDSGFWRRRHDNLLAGLGDAAPPGGHGRGIPGNQAGSVALGVRKHAAQNRNQQKYAAAGRNASRDSSPELESDLDIYVDDEDVLERAIRTRLPAGSTSPEKRRSPSPEPREKQIVPMASKLRGPAAPPPKRRTSSSGLRPLASPGSLELSDNYIRFALRAEVQQRTEPIDATIAFFRGMTRTWTSLMLSLLVALLSLTSLRSLFQAPAPRPAGDLVKVAGVARSFEPLIYYSEHAVAQVQDLQATSIAVWDLGESVRTSTMRDARAIVRELDALSEAMKALAIEMTKFFASVDGDIDGILNVMDWAKMHLARLQQSPKPSTIGAVYDNLHNMLSSAHILEDASGTPTRIGQLTTYAFGLSNPQREQRMVQLLFSEFLTVLEGTVRTELSHSMTLFALFEAVDNHFLNLARTVVRESAAQDEIHADLLSSLWTRILGARASEVRKFDENRQLLRNVREKAVRNKGILVEHNSRLLTLKTGLESLRSKLVSPLVRGINSTTLTLEDQIRGLDDVNTYLQSIRQQQKGKVMEMLFASVPPKSRQIEDRGAGPATMSW